MAIKRITIEVLHPTDHHILKTFIMAPPRNAHGQRQTWTQDGVDMVLEKFVRDFDELNEGHDYHLVPMGNARFRLVNRPPAEVAP